MASKKKSIGRCALIGGLAITAIVITMVDRVIPNSGTLVVMVAVGVGIDSRAPALLTSSAPLNFVLSTEENRMGKSSALVNLTVVLLPLSLGMFFLVATALGTFSSIMVAIVVSMCGVALLAAAKLPAFRDGRWVSFGPQGLPSHSRVIYFLAWSIILVALLLWIGILLFVTA